MRLASTLVLLSLVACTAGAVPADTDTDAASTSGDDTDVTDDTEDDDTEDDDTEDDDTEDAETDEAAVFVACEGATGSCSGLNEQACTVGQSLGCGRTNRVACSPTVFCVTQLDGCPQAWCTALPQGGCMFSDNQKQTQQAACGGHTDEATCLSNGCSAAVLFDACTGSWSCELDYAQMDPSQRPAPEMCDMYDSFGFACDAVFE